MANAAPPSEFASQAYPTAHDEGWRHLVLGNYTNAEQQLSAAQYAVGGLSESNTHLVTVAIEPFTSNRLPLQTHKLRKLHHSFAEQTLHIRIAKNAYIVEPIIVTTSAKVAGTVLPHVVIELGAGATANIIEHFRLPQKNAVISSETKIIIGNGAVFEHVADLPISHGQHHFHHLRYELAEDAKLIAFPIMHGRGLGRFEMQAGLIGRSAQAHLHGTAIGYGSGQLMYETLQEHAAPHTESDLLYRNVVAGNARTFYHGLIHIMKQGSGANAYQKNQNLSLSSTARTYSSPRLEIEANDVRCTHGATAGPLDPEMLFYLRSRGLTLAQATDLMLTGFVESLAASLSNPVLRLHAAKIAQQAVKRISHASHY